MKRLLSSLWCSPTGASRGLTLALFGAAAIVLGGCPVYPDGQNAFSLCDGNTCYECPRDYISNECSPLQCAGDMDCPGGYSCNPYNNSCQTNGGFDGGTLGTVDATTPVPSSCAQPYDCPQGYTCANGNVCELGDCSVTGCLAGYVCELQDGSLSCESEGAPPDAGSDSGVQCQSSSDCSGEPGTICLDGTCVPPVDQCYDESQCPPGDECVQGACTPVCQTSTDGGAASCPTGYSCTNIDDSASAGVCTGNPTPCEGNQSICPPGTVCSQDHCVPDCGTGGTCPTGEVCIQGGCVPRQIPNFTCATDGVQDACASGSICIHHSCYIACMPDAGASACQSASDFNECKPVIASGSTYYVCGSATNLGTECNPTTGLQCPSVSDVCIDGFCH